MDMYGGYEDGVVGWNKKERTEEEIANAVKIEAFISMIHHWAAINLRIAFVNDLGSAVDISVTSRHIHVPLSDILSGKADPLKIILELTGNVGSN